MFRIVPDPPLHDPDGTADAWVVHKLSYPGIALQAVVLRFSGPLSNYRVRRSGEIGSDCTEYFWQRPNRNVDELVRYLAWVSTSIPRVEPKSGVNFE
jgi:hypothetical protein